MKEQTPQAPPKETPPQTAIRPPLLSAAHRANLSVWLDDYRTLSIPFEHLYHLVNSALILEDKGLLSQDNFLALVESEILTCNAVSTGTDSLSELPHSGVTETGLPNYLFTFKQSVALLMAVSKAYRLEGVTLLENLKHDLELTKARAHYDYQSQGL